MKYQSYGQLAGLPRNICKYSHIRNYLKSIALNTVFQFIIENYMGNVKFLSSVFNLRNNNNNLYESDYP